MTNLSTKEILSLKMQDNDARAKTVGDYLKALLITVLEEGEGFSGKRPFGNSGWEYDLYIPLIKAGVIKGSFDGDGYIDECDNTAGDKVIKKVVKEMF